MDLTSRDILRSLPPLVAGLLLGAAGWMGAGHRQSEEQDFLPQLVVRPANAQIVTTRGKALTADEVIAGRYRLEASDSKLSFELKPKGWPSSEAEVEEPRGMTTVRGVAPRATLSVSVKGDKDSDAELLELPKKTKLLSAQGQTRLEAGRHELLVQAPGYIPARLSVNLKPGERKEISMDLQAIPGMPSGFPGGMPDFSDERPPSRPPMPSIPSLPSSAARPPAYPPPAYRPPASAPPAYRPPPSAPPAYVPPARPRYVPPVSRPAPVPRFTPVAPAPQPAAPDPVPMFTPIGN